MIKPGDVVIHDGSRRVVVDIADYREEDDGGVQDVYAVLRREDDDPERKLNEDGSDVITDAVPVDQLEKA